MPKVLSTASYVCSACGAAAATWSGRCPQCEQWNTLELQAAPARGRSRIKAENLDQSLEESEARMSTGHQAIDEVFGGGIVAGSVNLISGEPGVGKSTLLIQIAAGTAKQGEVLYVSGEESLHQVGLRAKRLMINSPKLKFAASTSADEIAGAINSAHHKLVIVDSIQSIRCNEIGSSAGSISQVTSSAAMLTQSAKQSGTAIIIVGHVTKEGNVAGPKLLEHIVDVVLSLEGETAAGLKLLKSSKNRFGSTNDSAIFEMKEQGLVAVANPSAVLLSERKITDGSIVLATMEGSRSVLVEVQALVNNSTYGYPKRAASGFDASRLNLLVAVIERRTSVKLADKDVYLNIVGGLKVNEPAADLAVIMAICSAARGRTLKDNAVVFGEIGLSGEIRRVPFIDRRTEEAIALGFDYAIGPKFSNTNLGAKLKPVSDIRAALNSYLSS